MDFDKIVKKMWNKKGTIVSIEDIALLVDPDYPEGRDTALRDAYKICSRLVANSVFIRIRAGMFFVADGNTTRPIDIVDRFYWSIVRKVILAEAGREYAVGGRKAAELHLRDLSPPETLVVYTRDIAKNVRIASGYSIRFRNAVGEQKSKERGSTAAILSAAKRLDIDDSPLRVLSEEASILDCLLDKKDDGSAVAKKFLKKYHAYLSREKLWALVKVRYITAINRLRALAKESGYDALYRDCLDIIRREGANCFISASK